MRIYWLTLLLLGVWGCSEQATKSQQTISDELDAGEVIAFASDRGGDLDVYLMATDGTGLTRLTNHTDVDTDPAWSPDGRALVFASRRGGSSDLYRLDLDGGAVTRLTESEAMDAAPAWSPAGDRICFSSDREGDFEVYALDLATGDVSRLTDDPGMDRHASWSWRGALAFVSDRGGDDEVYVMEAAGGELRNLSRHEGQDGLPAWSPDGERLAYVSARSGAGDLYVADLDRPDAAPLNATFSAHNDGQRPSWSPDGDRLAFVSDREGSMDIHLLDLSPRLLAPDAVSGPLRWSPDGSRLAFVSQQSGDAEVYVMGRDGDGVLNISQHPAVDDDLAWSPSGDRLAFVTDRDGNSELYEVSVLDGSLANRTHHGANDVSPVWSAAGDQLAFRSDRHGAWDLYVLANDTTVVRLSTSGDVCGPVAWGSSDSEVAYLTEAGAAVVSFADSATAQVRGSIAPDAREASWSPGALRLAYLTGPEGGAQIQVLDLETGGVEAWVSEAGSARLQGWTDDGERVLFTSDLDGEPDLYVAAAEGEVYRLTVGGVGPERASVSSSGEGVLYSTGAGGIYLRDLRTQRLTDSGGYDWCPAWISR